MPKKLDTRLTYGGGSDPVIGWGVHIVERPNWIAFSLLSEIVLFLSLFIGIAWSLIGADPSAGFTVASYVVAVLTVANGLGIVMLSQQR